MRGQAWALRHLLLAALTCATWIGALSEADANFVEVTVGGQQIVLVIDRDQCVLDRDNPSDRRVYDLVERGLAGHNELLLAAADCEQIPPWRNGLRPTLDDFTQVQVGLAYRDRDLVGRESATAQEICAALRTNGSALVDGPLAAVRERFNRITEEVRLNESKFLGVVGEDPDACYASLLQRVRTDQGADKLVLSVYAHVVVRGRLLYIYRFTEGDSATSLVRLTDLLRQSVRAHLEANQK